MSSTRGSSDYVIYALIQRVPLFTACNVSLSMQMQEEAALHEQYTRVITPEPALNEETEDVCGLLKKCYDLRQGSARPGVLAVTCS